MPCGRDVCEAYFGKGGSEKGDDVEGAAGEGGGFEQEGDVPGYVRRSGDGGVFRVGVGTGFMELDVAARGGTAIVEGVLES